MLYFTRPREAGTAIRAQALAGRAAFYSFPSRNMIQASDLHLSASLVSNARVQHEIHGFFKFLQRSIWIRAARSRPPSPSGYCCRPLLIRHNQLLMVW